MAILVPIAAGLVGTVVGAIVAWFAGRAQHRLETTFAMHREFHSPEMTRSRNLAGQTVRDNRSSSFEDMRVKLSPEVTQHVWNVMYFYQRLCLAIKLRDVHRSYIPEMFGENFCWWYSKSYEHQLVPLNWQAGRHIKWLMNWIERSAPADELRKWRTRAATMEDPRPTPEGMLYRWRRLRRMHLFARALANPHNGRAQLADRYWTSGSYGMSYSCAAARLRRAGLSLPMG